MGGRKIATEALRWKRENPNPPGTCGKMKETGKRGREIISHCEKVVFWIYRTDLGNLKHSWGEMLLLAGVWRCSLDFIVSIIDQGLVLAGIWREFISQNWCSCLHLPEVPGAQLTPAATCLMSQEIIVPLVSLFAPPAKVKPPLKEQSDKP